MSRPAWLGCTAWWPPRARRLSAGSQTGTGGERGGAGGGGQDTARNHVTCQRRTAHGEGEHPRGCSHHTHARACPGWVRNNGTQKMAAGSRKAAKARPEAPTRNFSDSRNATRTSMEKSSGRCTCQGNPQKSAPIHTCTHNHKHMSSRIRRGFQGWQPADPHHGTQDRQQQG